MNIIRILTISLLNILISTFSLYGSCIAPLSLQCAKRYQSLNNQTCGVKVDNFLTDSFAAVQDYANKCKLSSVRLHMQAIEKALKHFSLENSQKLLEHIAFVEESLTSNGFVEVSSFEALRVAILTKAVEQLLQQAYKTSLETLGMLEMHKKYWAEQYEHQNYYFFHRSPLKWFSKASRKSEIIINKKRIDNAYVLHKKVIGRIALLAAGFDAHLSRESQYAWIKHCCISLSHVCFKQPLQEEWDSRDNCIFIVNKLSKALDRRVQSTLKKLQHAFMPSHIERNWVWYTAGIAIVAGGYHCYKKHPTMFSATWSIMHDKVKENYRQYLNQPIQDVAQALGLSKSDEKLLDAKKLCQQITSGLQEIVDNIGDHKNNDRKNINLEEVQGIYVRTAQDFRDFHNQNFAKIVEWSPSNQEIDLAAASLDKRFLRQMYDIYSRDADAAGYLQIKAIINKAIPLLNIGGQVAAYRGEKVVGGLIKIIDPITQFIQFFIKQSELMVTQSRLSMAGIALLPAAGVIWGAYKGIRSFGGSLLPKGYDDTPVRACLVEMVDLIDDAYYVKNQESLNDFDEESLGALFYYSARLEKEMAHLAQKKRAILQQLLEKFYLSSTLQGKKIYLEKMLHEYYSWPRFIQR